MNFSISQNDIERKSWRTRSSPRGSGESKTRVYIAEVSDINYGFSSREVSPSWRSCDRRQNGLPSRTVSRSTNDILTKRNATQGVSPRRRWHKLDKLRSFSDALAGAEKERMRIRSMFTTIESRCSHLFTFYFIPRLTRIPWC